MQEYDKERGFNTLDIYQMPFLFAMNNEQLINSIYRFNMDCYGQQLRNLMESLGIYDDRGDASTQLSKLITENVFQMTHQ